MAEAKDKENAKDERVSEAGVDQVKKDDNPEYPTDLDDNPKKEKKGKEKEDHPPLTEPLTVFIRDNDKVIFQGKAKSITTYNDFGDFDVLAGHTEFISLIYDKLKVKKDNDEEQDIPIDRGVIRIFKNQVDIFLGLDAVAVEKREEFNK
jgi:hypothetical protein